MLPGSVALPSATDFRKLFRSQPTLGLAAAYADAAATAAGIDRVGGPGDHASLVSGLERAADAYAAMAAGVRLGDAAAFDAARERVADAEGALRGAIEHLSRAAAEPSG